MFKHVEHLWNTPGSVFNLDSTFIRRIIFVYMHILLFSFRLKKKERIFSLSNICKLYARCLSCSINEVRLSLVNHHRWHNFITSTIHKILWWSKFVYQNDMIEAHRYEYAFLWFHFQFCFEWGILNFCVAVDLVTDDRCEADAFKLQCKCTKTYDLSNSN